MFFSKPTGLYVLLDEESHFPKATSDTLVAKLHSNLGKCTYYKQPRGNTPTFGLKHYAGEVEYTCDEFLEKNRDSCVPPCIASLASPTWAGWSTAAAPNPIS